MSPPILSRTHHAATTAVAVADAPSERLIVRNPATGETVGEMPVTPPAAVIRAVARARDAFAVWSKVPAAGRAAVLIRARDLLVERSATIAATICAETGKVRADALGNIPPILDAIGYYASLAKELENGEPVGSGSLLNKKCWINHNPVGVVAVISPANLPLFLAMAQIVPALAAGNTAVHKPSEWTPLTGAAIAQLFADAGLPEGALETIYGGPETGATLADAGPDFISFTGSAAAGRRLHAQAARTLTPVALELGGKDPMIVCDDADVERAASAAVWGAFTNAGQTCLAVQRCYVDTAIYDTFAGCVVALTNNLRVGPDTPDCDTDIGAIIVPNHLETVEAHIADALECGAHLMAGGHRVQSPGGRFFAPTVLTSVHHGMRVMREETFGPVLPIMRVQGDDEAVALANDSEFGLGASLWTQSAARARDLARRLDAGSVCINDVLLQAANPRLPFGGVKASGLGRAFGRDGYTKFCHQQGVMANRIGVRTEPTWYPYDARTVAVLEKLIALYHSRPAEKLRRLFGRPA